MSPQTFRDPQFRPPGEAMPLQRISKPVTLAAILSSVGLSPEVGWILDAGVTTPPANPMGPIYGVELTEKGDQYEIKRVQIAKANEGDNISVHLKAGLYETNMSFMDKIFEKDRSAGKAMQIGSYLVKFSSTSSNRVYLYMPPDIASLNAAAEEEHCADIIYAFNKTLEAFQRGRFIDLMQNPSKVSENSVTMAKDWARDFGEAAGRTVERDDRGWHSFGLAIADAAKIPNRDNPTYLTGKRRDAQEFPAIYLKYTTGTTEIGRHSSESIMSGQ
ncbi:hypothetical protein ACGFX8_37655 [Streptomyces sp. NPDC048362]|uniref:hypothetical protein n=1 Tax=Streptomyces sp. NPDC048362 TaxID=3365539 RepID=UPI0037110B6A